MARILYGLCGVGYGHSTRAKIIAKHLVEQGHEVVIATYKDAYGVLKDDFDIIMIDGPDIIPGGAGASIRDTLIHNILGLPSWIKCHNGLTRQFSGDATPDFVISDVEPITAWYAKRRGIPLISVDNHRRMGDVEVDVPRSFKNKARLISAYVKTMVPRPDMSIVTSFVVRNPRNKKTFVFPPLIRPEIEAVEDKVKEGDFHLVYITSYGGHLLTNLNGAVKDIPDEKFIVYGADKHKWRFTALNLQAKPFSAGEFALDLARCKSVIGTAGFGLVSEAIHLGKPMLAIPLPNQIEQEWNAIMYKSTGLGEVGTHMSPYAIRAFFRYINNRVASATGSTKGNAGVTAKIDEFINEFPRN